MPRKNQPGCPCGCSSKETCEFFCGPLVTIDPPPGGISFRCAQATADIAVNQDGTLGPIVLLRSGSCYTTNPTVTISPPPGGGTTATAVATVGGVIRASVTASGQGFTSPPTVTFSAPGGQGTTAQGIAIISGGRLVGIQITDPGSLYTTNPTVTIAGGGGNGATAAAMAGIGQVTGLNLTNRGSGYTVDNTPPAQFQLTIAGPRLTVGPITLDRGATPDPGFPFPGQVAPEPNGRISCAWWGMITADVPANGAMPALRDVEFGAFLALSADGGYWLSTSAKVTIPNGGQGITCGDPPAQTMLLFAVTWTSWDNGEAGAYWPFNIISCPARPFSQTFSRTINPILNFTFGFYWMMGGDVACPPVPTITVNYTLTEVVPPP